MEISPPIRLSSRATKRPRSKISASPKKSERTMTYSKLVQEVSSSWDQVKQTPDFDQVFGGLLFERILQLHPSAENVFPIPRSCSSYMDSQAAIQQQQQRFFRRHGQSFARMMDEIISILAGGPKELPRAKAVLMELGRRHAHYGIRSHLYPIVGTAFLQTIECILKQEDAMGMSSCDHSHSTSSESHDSSSQSFVSQSSSNSSSRSSADSGFWSFWKDSSRIEQDELPLVHPSFPKETAEAWTTVYNFISGTMMEVTNSILV